MDAWPEGSSASPPPSAATLIYRYAPAAERGGANCSFHVIAKARDSGSVGDLAYLRGKIIAVVGDVKDYRGHPEIIVRDREQLQVAADEAPPEFDAGQRGPAAEASPAPGRFPASGPSPAWATAAPGRAPFTTAWLSVV